jgi:lipoate-protein ligase A
MNWRLLLTPPLSGAENMALDDALMGRARATGECVVRVYSWSVPTVSFGRHQAAREHYDAAELRRAGIDVVRRPTGGRAILHHREITYSVTAPAESLGTLRAAYDRINGLLSRALQALGVHADIAAPASRAPRPGDAPCFAEPTAGELIVDGLKLAGSAQWREGGVLLQHGSILVDDDQHILASLTARAERHPAPAVATLRRALGRAPRPEELAEALHREVVTREDARASPIAIDAELEDGVRLALARYSDARWTWRR